MSAFIVACVNRTFLAASSFKIEIWGLFAASYACDSIKKGASGRAVSQLGVLSLVVVVIKFPFIERSSTIY